jgi:hypothetical protein
MSFANVLTFETRTPHLPSSPARADVACFVGFVALRPGPLPEDVIEHWRQTSPEAGILSDASQRPSVPLPVVVDSAAAFDALFDGMVRTSTGLAWEAYLAGAVRDFFRQGGRRAWIVAVADPGVPPRSATEVAAALDRLLPASPSFSAGDRATWRGLGHVMGLPDVALVCLPDLPNLVGAPLETVPPLPGEPVAAPGFVECSEPDPRPPVPLSHAAPAAPRLGDAQWERWQATVRRAVDWLARYRPDAQLILGLPLWQPGQPGEAEPLLALEARLRPYRSGGVGSAYLQLAYPWLATDDSRDRPGGLAPADGVLAGMIARSCLSQGTFRPVTGAVPEGLIAVAPALSARATRLLVPVDTSSGSALQLCFLQRVSTLGLTHRGYELLSDVTTSSDPVWRHAGLNRLMGVLRRACTRIGEALAFEASGPQTWRRLRESVENTLAALRGEGAFSDSGEAYRVRCDQTTMTQNDIDNGRLIAHVSISPRTTIERIAIVLSVSGGGELRLVVGRAA